MVISLLPDMDEKIIDELQVGKSIEQKLHFIVKRYIDIRR
jgi:cytochrome c-type biogenesis protein CcmH/NrfF